MRNPIVDMAAAMDWACGKTGPDAEARDQAVVDGLLADLRREEAQAQAKCSACAYCGAYMGRPVVLPAHDDDAAWAAIARLHARDCEWVTTRAHSALA